MRTLIIVLLAVTFAEPVAAMSCGIRQEINGLVHYIPKHKNIVEVKVNDVVVDAEKETIELKVDTIEVFKGSAISSYLLGSNKRWGRFKIAGIPDITACGKGQGIHVQFDRWDYEKNDLRRKSDGVFKSGNKPNPLNGFPWHSCGHYKSLTNQNVVLLGRGGPVSCTDGIIEIYALARPDLLRGFLRCVEPAVEFSKTLSVPYKYVTGLPGKGCMRPDGRAYGHMDEKCIGDHRRLTWMEELVGRFSSAEQLAIRMMCPNPLSIR